MLGDAMFQKYGKTLPPGEIIFSEWEPGENFYLIYDGHVRVSKIVSGREKILDTFGPGDIFGEMAILEQQPRSATITTLDEVKVLEFNKQNFELLMKSNPEIALRLLKMFCKRIYDARRQLRVLTFESIELRIADIFVMLAEKSGHMHLNEDEPAPPITLPITLDDIAAMCGSTVQEVNKYLNMLHRQGKIDMNNNAIGIPNIMEFDRMIKSYRRSKQAAS